MEIVDQLEQWARLIAALVTIINYAQKTTTKLLNTVRNTLNKNH